MTPRGRAIAQFMWGYQHFFRTSVKVGATSALEAVGFDGDVRVLLVGFRVAGDHRFAVCIEPETGPYKPSDFEGVEQRADELYHRNPESKIWNSDPRTHELRQAALRNEARAICEVLEASEAGSSHYFFASGSPRVDDYEVHVVIGVRRDALDAVPRVQTTTRDRFHVTPSLVHGVIEEILSRAARGLYMPDPGAGLLVLDAGSAEIVRRATERFVRSILLCAGYWFGEGMDMLLNSVSALPYEGREGLGRLVLAKEGHPSVDVQLSFRRSIELREVRTVRKVLEGSGPSAHVLVAEGKVYGLGTLRSDYDDSTETAFTIDVLGRGAWELSHAGQPLLSVQDGIARLPVHVLNVDYFIDVVHRLFPSADTEALVALAEAASQHAHGAMLVISGDAGGEAKRLSPQAWEVEPTSLSQMLLTQLTGMDGAVLVDPQGNCHAIGVILDGHAAGRGDPGRGSRLNNAVRYLDSAPAPAVVVVYSADGTIDILPVLRPRISRAAVAGAVERYLRIANQASPEAEELSDARDAVKDLRFYLSQAQCDAVNSAYAVIDKRAQEEGSVRIIHEDLVSDRAMNDSYWLEEG